MLVPRGRDGRDTGRARFGHTRAVELIAATSGVGYLIMQAGDYLNVALVFSGIITIAITGLTLDARLRGLLYLASPSKRG